MVGYPVGVGLCGLKRFRLPSQRVLSTYPEECRGFILEIIIMLWESIPPNST